MPAGVIPTAHPLVRVLVAVDFFLLTFPPLGWWFMGGGMGIGLTYMIGSCTFVALSLPVMLALEAPLDGRDGGDKRGNS